MRQSRVRAVFMRGGTSRALFFQEADLPKDISARDRILLAALGSPDPYGRQLDGLGGGISSLSKAVIVGPPTTTDADLDYTFAQVSVSEPLVDYTGNCGNCTAAVGPFAIDEGLVPAKEPETAVRLHNTNTRKLVVARVSVADGEAAATGDFELPGVPGRGARIALNFLDPGGAVTGALLPTGKPRELLETPGVGSVEVSLVDATNPMVFVRARDLGCVGTEPPDAVDSDRPLLMKLEAIRRAAAGLMGLGESPALPKVAMVAPPGEFSALDGRPVRTDEADVTARVISMGKCHRAFALTAAICLAVAARIEGSVVHEALGTAARRDGLLDLRLAHPSGILPVNAVVELTRGLWQVRQVTVYRTARRLMEGWVRIPTPE